MTWKTKVSHKTVDITIEMSMVFRLWLLSYQPVMVESGTAWKGPHRFSFQEHILAQFGSQFFQRLFLVLTDCLQLKVFFLESMELLDQGKKTDPAVQDWHERLRWPTAPPVFMFLPSSEHWSAWPPCRAEPPCLSLCPDHLVTSASTASRSLGLPPAVACRNIR